MDRPAGHFHRIHTIFMHFERSLLESFGFVDGCQIIEIARPIQRTSIHAMKFETIFGQRFRGFKLLEFRKENLATLASPGTRFL